ncbi:carboxy terminal-processing peptidase [Balneatrix alpica]|uniref:Carboxy terminal-processing peptidase n=1 Tax=Balneatrix alpica TaxID=75684 RepID=A0ABV5Z7U7_9GAMM|nr:carboxy terminal-processing peptidase [Balneatrix alpica]
MRLSTIIFATGLTLLLSPLAHSSTARPELNYQANLDQVQQAPYHAQLTQSIVSMLENNHYRSTALNDELASKVFDRYLTALDPSRTLLLQSDLDKLAPMRKEIDDQLRAGQLDDAFAIFNLVQQRRLERLNYQLDLLAKGPDAYQLPLQESIEADRKEAPWPRTQAELEDLWRKQLKNSVLALIMADKTLEEAKPILERRLGNQIQRQRQTKSEDAYQVFMNAYAELYDPHTQYFSPRSSENFNINMSLSLEGIGAVLQSEDEQTKVVRLVPGGPADKSGQLKPADLITGVAQGEDGEMQDVVGWRLDEVVDLIRGPKDTTVRLQIQPAGGDDKKQKIISLVRSKVKLEDQAAQKKVLELPREGKTHKIGVVTLPTFYLDFQAAQAGDPNYKSTTRDVEQLIQELKHENIEGLIVDLRNNGGGSLREANELIGLFIRQGPTVQVRDSQGNVNIMGDPDPKVVYEGPLVVLVNRLSASASEIFAGAIQDYGRGLVLGSQTFGKGTVQTLLPLDVGQLKLTQAKFYRISGESTQHKGVIPDISFPSSVDNEQIGESALPNALAWDKVRPLRYPSYGDYAFVLDILRQRHQTRVSADPDFVYMVRQMGLQKELSDEKILPLYEEGIRERRQRTEQRLLDEENKRRQAKGLPLYPDFASFEESSTTENNEEDPILAESGRILADFVSLSNTVLAERPRQ